MKPEGSPVLANESGVVLAQSGYGADEKQRSELAPVVADPPVSMP